MPSRLAECDSIRLIPYVHGRRNKTHLHQTVSMASPFPWRRLCSKYDSAGLVVFPETRLHQAVPPGCVTWLSHGMQTALPPSRSHGVIFTQKTGLHLAILMVLSFRRDAPQP
jgi:hypothetical protein